MLKSNKFITKQQQVAFLENNNIVIDNVNILLTHNFYHLINNYGKIYMDGSKYINGTKLSFLKRLFDINLNISALLFKEITNFEHKLKKSLMFHVVKQGALSYTSHSSYTGNNKEISKLIKNLIETSNKNASKYKASELTNGLLPFTLLVDELTFGQLRMIVKLFIGYKDVFKDIGISYRNKRTLEMVNTFRNSIYHANPLMSTNTKQLKDGTTRVFKLSEL